MLHRAGQTETYKHYTRRSDQSPASPLVIILDTNVLSELVKPEPNATVLAWIAKQRRGELYTTTISEAEIAYGLALLPKGRRREALTQAVARLLGEGLGGRVFPFDRAAATAFGELAAKRRAIGNQSPLPMDRLQRLLVPAVRRLSLPVMLRASMPAVCGSPIHGLGEHYAECRGGWTAVRPLRSGPHATGGHSNFGKDWPIGERQVTDAKGQ